MFVKKSWNTKGKKRYICYEIAVSYRPKGGKYPRTKTLANITHLPKPIIDKITALLKDPDNVVVNLKSFFKKSYILGSLVFLYYFMRNIGVISALKSIPLRSRILLIGVIMNRILNPRSKLGYTSWIKNTAFPVLFGMEKKKLVVSQVYKAMDVLFRRMDEVLDAFLEQNNKGAVFLIYDVTSVFFEGKGPEELARYGFSRDEKPNNPQILLLMCLNEKRLPVYFDVIEGNVQDKKTVIPMIKKMKERFGIKNSIFVGDRGMVSIENLDFLEKEGIDYIVALTHVGARKLIFRNNVQLEVFDRQVPVTIFSDEKRKYVLCGSEFRRERDRVELESILEKGRRALEKVKDMVERGRIKDREKVIRRAQKKLTEAECEKFYDFTYRDGKFEIVERRENIEMARKLCGYYVLETTLKDMDAKSVEENYKQLKHVENAFRELKDIVEIRPIFHWKARRVKTHVFLCILAQVVVNQIKGVLKEKGWLRGNKGQSFERFLEILNEISLGMFEVEGKEEGIITALTSEQRELIRMFDMDERYFKNPLVKIVD